jgi:hypothetical protein
MTDTVLRRISEGLCLLGVGSAGYLTIVSSCRVLRADRARASALAPA